jgi:hypothetical protein
MFGSTRQRRSGVCVVMAAIVAAVAAMVSTADVALSAPPLPDRIDFNRDIRPILSNRCYGCHGPDATKREAGLQLDTHERAIVAADSGSIAIVPGKPRESELIARVSATDPDVVMPPPRAGNPLSPREIAILDRWIEQGAAYDVHWAYGVPTRPPLPEASRSEWTRNPIDRLAALHATVVARYATDRKAAATLATTPLGPLPAGANPADMAAWTMAASALLNLDECVMCS